MADVFRHLDGNDFELSVETDGRGLRLTITEPLYFEGLVFNLDRQAASDLVDQLESWRAGWFTETALRERAAEFDRQAIAGMRERAIREGRTGV